MAEIARKGKKKVRKTPEFARRRDGLGLIIDDLRLMIGVESGPGD
jgi:hypothetical protein